MTIFVEVTRKYVIATLESIKTRISNDDNKYIGLLRNSELSHFKIDLANQCIDFMKEIVPHQTDELSKNHIIEKILSIKDMAYFKALGAGQSEGKFGLEMMDIIALIKTIFQKMGKCTILDMKTGQDPFNQFCFYSGMYLGDKCHELFNLSFINRIAHHPRVSDLWKLPLQKEELLAEKITKCREALDALNAHHPKYKEHYQIRVLDFVDDVIRENIKTCEKHSTGFGFPLVNFSLFSVLTANSFVAPKHGKLNEFMNLARSVINGEQPDDSAVVQPIVMSVEISEAAVAAVSSASSSATEEVSVAASESSQDSFSSEVAVAVAVEDEKQTMVVQAKKEDASHQHFSKPGRRK
jgi:hypothetical protein